MKETNIKLIYLYLASLIALPFFLFGTVLTVQGVMSLINGETYYQTYTQFRTLYDVNEGGEYYKPDTPELRAMYEEDKAHNESMSRKRTMQHLAGSVTSLILGLVLWQYFWRQAKSVK